MGWLFPFEADTKEKVVKIVLDEYNTPYNNGGDITKFTVVKHSLRGNNLWMVLRIETKEKVSQTIMLYMLQYDREGGIWGYKDIEACCGPCAGDCPVKFLDMVTEDCKVSHYKDFETRVRQLAKEKSEKTTLKRTLQRKLNLNFGDVVHLTTPLTYKVDEINAIKITYQQKSVIAGTGLKLSNNENLIISGLFRVPAVKYWKSVERNGERIYVNCKTDVENLST